MMGSTAPVKGQKHSIPEMQALAKELRRDIIQTIYTAGSGHPGGSLSELEILIALYFNVMNHDAANPRWPDRDRFILSKGHASPGFYAGTGEGRVLSQRRAGYLPAVEQPYPGPRPPHDALAWK